MHHLVNVYNNYEQSPFVMGKLTISIAIFNSYVSHYQSAIWWTFWTQWNNIFGCDGIELAITVPSVPSLKEMGSWDPWDTWNSASEIVKTWDFHMTFSWFSWSSVLNRSMTMTMTMVGWRLTIDGHIDSICSYRMGIYSRCPWNEILTWTIYLGQWERVHDNYKYTFNQVKTTSNLWNMGYVSMNYLSLEMLNLDSYVK